MFDQNPVSLFLHIESRNGWCCWWWLYSKSFAISQCLKITQNVAFDFFHFWHFPPFFVLLKVTCLVTLFDCKLQVFKTLTKIGHFLHFFYSKYPTVPRDSSFVWLIKIFCRFISQSLMCVVCQAQNVLCYSWPFLFTSIRLLPSQICRQINKLQVHKGFPQIVIPSTWNIINK